MSDPVRVVFDTNVLLSLFVFQDSRFAPLRGEVASGRWIAFTCLACLVEYRRVLGYPLFNLAIDQQEAAYADYLAFATVFEGPTLTDRPLPRCQDKDDQKFLELARDAQADWLVSADKLVLKLRRGHKLDRLFHILTPDEALQKVSAGVTALTIPP